MNHKEQGSSCKQEIEAKQRVIESKGVLIKEKLDKIKELEDEVRKLAEVIQLRDEEYLRYEKMLLEKKEKMRRLDENY